MRNIIAILSVIVLLSSCGGSGTSNQLTEEQKKDGWKLLFDGKTMDGWRIFKGKENDTWEVIDGTLHCKPTTETSSKRADLMTTEMYQNFELSFDWKISKEGNSGVMYRVTEEYDVPYATGPEYQLIDDKGYPKEVPEHFTGADYDVYAPSEAKSNAIGEWNTTKIIVNGNNVEHWLNGTKVVSYELDGDDWQQKVAASKWKEFPGYGKAPSGYIDLQDHGHEVWFRNVMIKTL
ncbi:MAG: DUF1080 domain-containing protein [Cyclobacteriaceae bacterium]|nr:DUF1080 domain-containing protein [Cyclobacteriaceae bacterium]